MRLVISQDVRQLFPELSIALVWGQITKEKTDAAGEISKMKESALGAIKSNFSSNDDVNQHDHITAWREAYQKFGVRAKDYRPTHEALARRLLKQDALPSINPIVDIYLTNQCVHMLPHGGYDLNQLQSDVTLEVASSPESFEPLGGGQEMTQEGEIVYKDSARVLTRRWNHRDCEATKITEGTKSFVLLIEAPAKTIPAAKVASAAEDLVGRYRKCYEGEFDWMLVTAPNYEGKIPVPLST